MAQWKQQLKYLTEIRALGTGIIATRMDGQRTDGRRMTDEFRFHKLY